MEYKTKINAVDGKQDILITREFDLPVELLFKAHAEPHIIGQWMGTKVLKFEGKKNGCWQYETTDGTGNIVFSANGVFHEFILDQKITRTFEMENAPFGVQLDFLEFVKLTDNTSQLTMQSLYRSVAQRDQLLRLPFSQGLNIAHNRLQEIAHKLK